MIEATISELKQTIADGRDHEAHHKLLFHYIHDNLDALHSAIAITASSPADALVRFVEDYVATAPDHLQALLALADEVKLGPYVKPYIDMAITYFIQPPDLIRAQEGLHGLLYKAYLSHRLMEELNDQIMSLSGGAALAPMDMSMANIIAHSLIGDDIASQLDHLVLMTIETTITDKHIFNDPQVIHFMEQRRFDGWDSVLEQWPCFAKDCGVHLTLAAT